MPNDATGGILDEKMLKDLLKPIIDSVNTVSEGQKGLALEVQGIKEASRKPLVVDPEKDPAPNDRDLEGMSRKDFLAHIMEGVKGVVTETVKPVTQKIEDKTEKDLEADVNKAVAKAGKDHKDFWEWKKEMGEELVKNPYLMPEDAYQLARLRAPDKAKEMTEKFPSDEKVKTDEEKKANEEKPEFGGLTPTSSLTEPSEKMKFPDASEMAWNETMTDQAEK